MSSSYVPLAPATVALDAEGRLYSPAYGDVYHSPGGAGPGRACIPAGQWPAGTLARQGCLHGLRDRVRAGPEFPGAVAGMARRPGAQRAHVLAVEGHPFAPADLAALLARHAPPLAGLARELAAQWSLPLPGLHRLEFDGGAVTLTWPLARRKRWRRVWTPAWMRISWMVLRPGATRACGNRRCCANWPPWQRRARPWPPGPAPASCVGHCPNPVSTRAVKPAMAASGT